MGFLSICTGYRSGKYRDGSKTVGVHEFRAGDKPQTAMSCIGPGIEINPANGENLFISRVKGSSSFVVSIGGVNQNIAPDTARGERRIFSVSEDGETIKAVAKFKNDGTIELNGGSTEAARRGDATKLDMTGTDIQTLAASLLTTGAFTPSGSSPGAGTPVSFTGGEITSGTGEVLMP